MSKEPPSPQETEVWKFIALGLSKKEIAEKMGLAIKTVETLADRLYKKLGARSRADAARLAVGAGLIGSIEPNPPANKRTGYDPVSRDHDMAILVAELELQKAKTRAAEARADRLEAENRNLLRRIPLAS